VMPAAKTRCLASAIDAPVTTAPAIEKEKRPSGEGL
jgi:hypothetical protein